MLNDILTAAAPYIVSLFGSVLTLAIGAVAEAVRRKTGIQIGREHQENMHRAIMTGVQLAIAKKIPTADRAGFAVRYAKQSAPDAFQNLKPKPNVPRQIAEAKLGQLLGVLPLTEETRVAPG